MTETEQMIAVLRSQNKELTDAHNSLVAEIHKLSKQLDDDTATFARRIGWMEDWKRNQTRKIEELQSIIDGPGKPISMALGLIDAVLDEAESLRLKRNEIAELVGMEPRYEGDND